MTESSKLDAHWRFAAGNAFGALETQIRDFNFARIADGHTYSGLSPQKYSEIIDGFLKEDSTVVPGGNRRALEALKTLLVPMCEAFDTGWGMAKESWNSENGSSGSVATPSLHAMAYETSPFTDLEREWFVEGYCQSWAQLEFDSLK